MGACGQVATSPAAPGAGVFLGADEDKVETRARPVYFSRSRGLTPEPTTSWRGKGLRDPLAWGCSHLSTSIRTLSYSEARFSFSFTEHFSLNWLTAFS